MLAVLKEQQRGNMTQEVCPRRIIGDVVKKLLRSGVSPFSMDISEKKSYFNISNRRVKYLTIIMKVSFWCSYGE